MFIVNYIVNPPNLFYCKTVQIDVMDCRSDEMANDKMWRKQHNVINGFYTNRNCTNNFCT